MDEKNEQTPDTTAPETTAKPDGPSRQKKEHPALRLALAAFVGGIVGAGALFGALKLTGSLDSTTTITQTGQQVTQNIQIDSSAASADLARAVAAKATPSVASIYVTIDDNMSLGSGVILDTDGNIITNSHVIEDAQDIQVIIDEQTYDAVVVGVDDSSDLAVIKVSLPEGVTVTPIEVGDSAALQPGDWVMTIGSPFGLDQSVSAGIVSSLYRSTLMTTTTGNRIYANLIQTDATINPGNSGGALVDDEGKLVGIATLYSSDTESFAGIGFAIPGNYAVSIAQKIIAGEQVTHAYLGLSMQTVTSQVADENHLSVDAGAYVAQVIEGSPAEGAGIQVGDVVTGIGDDAILSADAAIIAVRSHQVGDVVTVTVMRGSEELTFEVTLGSDEVLQELQAQQSGEGEGTSAPDDLDDQQEFLDDLYDQDVED